MDVHIKTVKSLYPDARRVLFVTWFTPLSVLGECSLDYFCSCGAKSVMVEKEGVFVDQCQGCGFVNWTHRDFFTTIVQPPNGIRIPGRWVGNNHKNIFCRCGEDVKLRQSLNGLWSGRCLQCRQVSWNYSCVWGYDQMQTPGPLTQELIKRKLSLDPNRWQMLKVLDHSPVVKSLCCKKSNSLYADCTPSTNYIYIDLPRKHYGSVVYYAQQCEKCSKGWWACDEPQKLENLLAINLKITCTS